MSQLAVRKISLCEPRARGTKAVLLKYLKIAKCAKHTFVQK